MTIIGTAEHYAQFIRICRNRIEQLSITYDTVDALAGFPARYTSKLLSENKGMSALSLFTMARALALIPMFGHDEKQHQALRQHSAWVLLRRPGPRWRPKKRSAIDRSAIKLYRDFLHKRAQAGGLAYRKKVPKSKQRAIGREAVRMRKWRPVREAQ